MTTQIKAWLIVAGTLVGVGAAWSEWTTRLNAKADRVEVHAVDSRLSNHLTASAAEWRVNRVLLCRMPEIRPDSHCEGYR